MSDIDELYKKLLRKILAEGKSTSPRGKKCLELVGEQMMLTDSSQCILTNKLRNINHSFMRAEWLWMQAGDNRIDLVSRFNKKICQYSDNGETFFGAYGPRLIIQWDYCYNKLLSDPDTRQAVINIWRENPAETKDVPCTMSLHFLRRDNRLNLLAYMRSNDAWLGLPYDTFNFCQLLNTMAGMLKLQRGFYMLTASSLHLYEENITKAERLVSDETTYSSYQAGQIIFNDNPFNELVTFIKWYDINLKKLLDGKLAKADLHGFKVPIGIKEHILFLVERVKQENGNANIVNKNIKPR